MTKLLARWDDFSKGEAGWTDKSKLPAGFITGEQVMVYRDGSVGPRCGVVDLASSATGFPAGTLYQVGYANITGAASEWVWIHKGTKVAMIPVYDNAGVVQTAQVWTQSVASFAATPQAGLVDTVDVEPGRTRIVLYNDKAYSIDWSTTPGTPILSALTGSPGGRTIEIVGPYLVIAGTVANPNRIFYSAAGNHNSWPAPNFFDVSGAASAFGAPTIIAIRALRDMLLVWTNTGQLFIVSTPSGELTVAGGRSIRQFLYGDRVTGPGVPESIGRDRAGSVWWTRRDELPYQQDQTVDLPSAVPCSFDGTQRKDYPALGGYLRQPSYQVERRSLTTAWPGRGPNSVMIGDQAQRILVKRDDAWSRHHLANIATEHTTPGLRGEVFGLDPGFTKLMAWVYELERPPWSFAGSVSQKLPYNVDDAASAISPSPWFATPQFRTPGADLISVQRVEVFFTAYETRDATNSHLECFVQQYDGTGAVEVLTATSVIPPDSETAGTAMIAGGTTAGSATQFDVVAPARPTRYRVAFYTVADQLPAPAVRVLLRGLRGVAVNEIVLYGDLTSQARP